MKLSKLRKHWMAAAAGLALSLGVAAPSMAAPVPSFTLAPSAFGLPTADFVANHIMGSSSELLHTTATGHYGSGWMQISGFNLNGNPLRDSVTGLGTYELYITYDLVDVWSMGNPNSPGMTNTLTKLDFKFWVDISHNNAYTQAAVDVDNDTGVEATVANTSDDILLAYGSLIQGVAGFDSLGGAFLNSIQNFAICTGAGSATLQGMPVTGALAAGAADCTSGMGNAYFKLPQPFYGLAFDEFNNTTQGFEATPSGLVAINQASGSIDFNRIPEPGSLALLGLGLLGAGLNFRRRRAR
ncbi:flocculation-associated PEP-CTERM protein PepA [Massilia horti]|uniref:Flocculation-associated PEP-CTERM protein PepA n=1 Tax=Massilia horti TaxID=2562153 RepID=A0A4Y9T122_9BURK|nr:flocculation-associated PEP-CTERM protein PepA [Massilia horti]TFW30696.1 flocculation-associated PEP-CTERM protein PepA [Massilia horti]